MKKKFTSEYFVLAMIELYQNEFKIFGGKIYESLVFDNFSDNNPIVDFL